MATNDTITAADLVGDPAAAIIRDQTRLAAAPHEVMHGLYLVTNADGSHGMIDMREAVEQGLLTPHRKTGRVIFHQADSLTGYLAKHGQPQTEIYADIDASTVTAVINASDASGQASEGDAGWGDHCAVLKLRPTEDWKDWAAASGKLYPQSDFAEFIEQHLPNFAVPSGADMLELAQTIKGATKVSWEHSKRLTSGQTAIEWREDTTATAGKKGQIAIPDVVELALQVYEGGNAYRVAARFRYRVNSGVLALGVTLERAGDVKRDAFGMVVEQVAKDTGRDVWHGSAPWHGAR